MLAAPLVHIHPEADHHHGSADHRHGGTVHTVFSQDLPCEFLVYDHASVADDESRCPLHLVALPLHGFEHLEIDMVLASSAESQIGKGTALDVAAHSFHAHFAREASCRLAAAPQSFAEDSSSHDQSFIPRSPSRVIASFLIA